MIIGIAGSFAAGKGAVVEYLVGEKGFSHYSSSDFITEEIERRKMPVNRDSMTTVANDLRKEHGASYITDSLFERARKYGGDVVIESLRAVAEVRHIKELGGVVLGVNAESKLRYERALSRGGVKDGVTYEKWLEQQEKESNPDDITKQNIFGALKEADFHIENNGTIEELHSKVDEILNKIKT